MAGIQNINNKPKRPANIDIWIWISSDNDIASLFAEKNKNLYNSVPSDTNILNEIADKIERNIANNEPMQIISVQDVVNSVGRTKSGKKDGETPFTSDHLKNAPHLFLVHLCLLYNACIKHGHVPTALQKELEVSFDQIHVFQQQSSKN